MEGDAELDSLLDEALNDFTPAAAGGVGAASGAAAAAALPFDPMAAGAPKRTKKRGGTQASHAAALAAEPAAPDMNEGLARLMQQLGHGAPRAGDAGEEDILATIAALEAQTRFTTGGAAAALDEDAAAAGPSDGLPPGMDEASYQAMLQQLEHLGADPSMASLLDSMMSQLLSKDVLYEPLQHICARYPGWLANKRGAIPEEEHARYTRQSALVAQLLAVFDSAPDDSSRVMHLMQEMQACGAPPQEIMSELAPGIEFGSDGAPRFPAVAADGSGGVPPELAASCAQM